MWPCVMPIVIEHPPKLSGFALRTAPQPVTGGEVENSGGGFHWLRANSHESVDAQT